MTLSIMFSLAVILCGQVCMCIDVYDYTCIACLRVFVCEVLAAVGCTQCTADPRAQGSMAIADCSLYIGQPL